ncbi:ImmA/IrrE family metallo-endopeptidase [Catellatospora sichuanensis]|uniref:ImmA/IrrE family metallo-endopeptidase n=1 Tax=Catellatospora sichuanensis TaxID=1969805 RepID=UPI001182012B|nr:ImmA/IrrE family metallo-endopeptidase [Catellatospora sichuanensis]
MDEGVIDRVRSVITRVSSSQAAFSELVGISADKLSKSLNAVRRFTSLELALIADAGDVSVDWLLTGRTREPALPTEEPSAGDEIRALVDRHAAAYERLRLLGRRPPLPRLPEPPAGPPGAVGRALAERAVAALREGGVPRVGTLSTADLAAAIEQVFAVDVAIIALPGGADGLAWQSAHGRLVLGNTTSQFTRQRFALAHALGHVLAGDAEQPLLDQHLAPGRQRAGLEQRADAFAAAFLLPADELRAVAAMPVADVAFAELRAPTPVADAGLGELQTRASVSDAGFAELVALFGVSAGAMAARLRVLGLLDADRQAELGPWTAARCHQGPAGREALLARMGAAQAPRLPARLVGELFGAYADGATTLVPLADLLQTPVDDLFAALVAEPSAARRGYADEPAFLP